MGLVLRIDFKRDTQRKAAMKATRRFVSRSRRCSLQEALAYKNEEIAYRFARNYKLSFEEADDIFEEVKKWLWLGSLGRAQRLYIYGPLLILDEMWHNFILFTKEYTHYCESNFGHYVHHAPVSRRELEELVRLLRMGSSPGLARMRRRQESQMRFVATHLGLSTLKKWYFEYGTKYGVVPVPQISPMTLPPWERKAASSPEATSTAKQLHTADDIAA